MNSDNYFAIWDLFYELIGGMWLITILGSILLIYVCAKYNLGMELSILIVCLWFAVIVAITANLFLWALVALFLAGWFYYVITKMRT